MATSVVASAGANNSTLDRGRVQFWMSVPLSRVEMRRGELAVDAAPILSTEKSLCEITSAARDAAVWQTLFLNGRDEPTERRRAAGHGAWHIRRAAL